MKKLWTLALLALALRPAPGRAQVIGGTVLDDASRAPMRGVAVELLTADSARLATQRTDSTGTFLFRPERAGRFLLRVADVPYPAGPVELDVGPAETVQVELRVGRTAVSLEPVVVTARRDRQLQGFYDRMRGPGAGRFLSREEIEARRSSARATDLLRMMPGVQLVPYSAEFAGAGNLITMRGGVGRCLPTVYIDGLPVAQHGGSGVDDLLTPGALEGVEVYTSAASAPSPILARDACGVVAFWTRRNEGGKWSWKKFLGGVGLVGLLLLVTR